MSVAERNLGVKISVGTDAHAIDGLQFMRYGIGQGRRQWLEAKDLPNTHPLKELKKLLVPR